MLVLLTASAVTNAATPPAATATAGVATLVGVRAAHHPGFDRVVFDFRGGLPAGVDVRSVDRLLGDATGTPVPVAGRATLQVRFEGTDAHDDAGQPTAPSSLAFALPNVTSVVRSGDFEAVTTYGIGLAAGRPFAVSTLRSPDRVVVDVEAAFRTVTRSVWFFDEGRYLRGTPPFTTPVPRPVLPRTPATGVTDRLFAGPTAAELARGLRLLPSGATGFRGLRITAGVARVQLVGGCRSGGSTVGIADELRPTLRQFPSVDAVKVLDPDGATENPWGPGDSIPECLEP